jgi:HD-GYP domain-containing protein (c-di-GMP phosphodiesterase class II)
MRKEDQVPFFDFVMCMSNAMDMINPALNNHQKQVAYIASSLSAELGLSKENQNNLLLSGLVHDVGALSLKDRLEVLKFEELDFDKHSKMGYLLLRDFDPFSEIAPLVLYHHHPWRETTANNELNDGIPSGSHILHLADRTAVLLDRQKEVLGQVSGICHKIKELSGKTFMPETVDALMSLAEKEYFWLDAVSPSITQILFHMAGASFIDLGIDGLFNLATLFSRIIDFRSSFTATHSNGVAASAESLARLLGFSGNECRMMKIAGYLHDLGKLAVPPEILEKPGKLTDYEFNIIRGHTLHTYRTLEHIEALDVINTWSSFHHERLDGKGYPFHYTDEDLSLGSKIMAVADVFTAITEDRPYRKGMTKEEALTVICQMASDSQLDSTVVAVIRENYDAVTSSRIEAQTAVAEKYQEFRQQTAIAQ